MKTNMEMANEVIMEVIEFNSKKKRFNKKAVMSLVAAVVLVLSLAVSASAGVGGIFSTQWRNTIKDAIIGADKTEGVEELQNAIAQSDDKFCYEDGCNEMLLDYKDVIEIDKTVTDSGLKFTFDKIVSGKTIRQRRVSGKLSNGTAVFEQYVRDSHFAIIEISREDAGKLTQKDIERIFRFGFLVEGYKPYISTMCMEGNCMKKEYDDEYTRYIAIEVTDLMIYADKGLGIAVYVYNENYNINIGDKIKETENAGFEFTEKVNGPHAVFNFKVDASYANKKAVKEFDSNNGMIKVK